MRKRLFFIATMMISGLFLGNALLAQSFEESGAYYCSQKKQQAHKSVAAIQLGPNSPVHSYDVIKYTMNIELMENFDAPYPHDYDADLLIRFKVDSTLNSIDLDAHNASLEIIAVGMAGTTFSHSDDILTIDLDQTYAPGEIVEVSIDYSHKNVVDEAFYAGQGFVFTDCEPEGARQWFPCWDKPADKALLELTAKVPDDVRLGSNGVLVDSVFSGDTLIYHWRSDYPIATYIMVMTAKKNYNLDIYYWERPSDGKMIPFRYYYSNENPALIEDVAESANEMSDVFSENFGEYPFDKNGFASASNEFTWGGMENQTLTTLCPGCWWESLIAHEFAHMWFGDMISPGTWADLWLNEGFATWSEARWFESYAGYSGYKNDIDANASAYLSNNPGWPIYNPEWAEETPSKSVMFNGAITYAKSACVLHLFRYIVGDEAFFDAIHAYATDEENFKHKTVITSDFIDKMSEEVGEDMSWFFEPWLEQENHPVYKNEYYFSPLGNGSWEVNFLASQVQDDGFFPMKLNIFIGFEDFSDTTVYFMNMENDESFQFEFEKKPIYITFDMPNEIVLKQATLILSAPEGKPLSESALLSNYPNPAAERTTISYQLQNAGKVSLDLFDLTGKSAGLLFEGYRQNGSHTFEVNTLDMESGIYFYRLTSGGETATGKMVVQ